MSDAIQSVGLTVRLAPAGSTTPNVANVLVGTNTFHVLNANATVYAYVGVFNTYAAAVAMDHPTSGADATGIPLAPNESMTIKGNFGLNPRPDAVYVSAITASGSTSVYATPITP